MTWPQWWAGDRREHLRGGPGQLRPGGSVGADGNGRGAGVVQLRRGGPRSSRRLVGRSPPDPRLRHRRRTQRNYQRLLENSTVERDGGEVLVADNQSCAAVFAVECRRPPEPSVRFDRGGLILVDVTLWHGKTRKPVYSHVSAPFRGRTLHVLTSDSISPARDRATRRGGSCPRPSSGGRRRTRSSGGTRTRRVGRGRAGGATRGGRRRRRCRERVRRRP